MTEIIKLINEIKLNILSQNNEFDIETWKNFELDFSKIYEEREEIIKKIKNNINIKTSGFYAIFEEEHKIFKNNCLYIGIGRPIWSRIKSHYDASKGKCKAVEWVRFFSENQKKLFIYWKAFSVVQDKNIDDKARLLIEAILTKKYNPKFTIKTKSNFG